MHLTGTLSSVINSSISSTPPSTLTLPKNVSKSIARTDDYQITSSRFDSQSFGYAHFASSGMDKWNPKSNTAISPFRTKPSSSSASTSSGCSSDCEHSTTSPDDEHPNHMTHDSSPDSPDSGVSESVNSADDLKHLDDEECDLSCKDTSPDDNSLYQSSSFELLDLDQIYTAKFDDISKDCVLPTDHDDSNCYNLLQHKNTVSDRQTIVSQLKKNAHSNFAKVSTKKPKFYCQWLDCDWPGSYDDLADHVREIHVELQPYLDSNGQVITWSKHESLSKSSRFSSKDKNEEDDDASINSCSDNEDDIEMEDADADSDDDSQSVAESCFRVTRRSKGSQCLQDASSLHPRRSSRGNQRLTENVKQSHQHQFVCLWRGCKVFGKPSSSRQWIERHVLEQHSGPKPFKCIVDSCGQRFKTQISLERHVNTHFRANNCLLPNGFSGANSYGNENNSNNNQCCKCSCHSQKTCDTTLNSFQQSTTMPTTQTHSKTPTKLTLRSEKTNRYSSTDSAISVTSISSVETSHSTSAQCLSRPSSINYSINDNCHTSCCCLTSKKFIDANDLSKSKFLKVNKKRSQLSATPPVVKCITDYEYCDDHIGNIVHHRYRTRQNALVLKRKNESAFKTVFVSKTKQLKTCAVIFDDLDFNGKNCEDITDSDVFNSCKKQMVQVFDKRLFHTAPDHFIFYSNIVSTRFSSINGASVEIEWHPMGVLPNQIVKKDEYHKYKVRKIHLKDLPDDAHFELLKMVNPKSSTKCENIPAKKAKVP